MPNMPEIVGSENLIMVTVFNFTIFVNMFRIKLDLFFRFSNSSLFRFLFFLVSIWVRYLACIREPWYNTWAVSRHRPKHLYRIKYFHEHLNIWTVEQFIKLVWSTQSTWWMPKIHIYILNNKIHATFCVSFLQIYAYFITFGYLNIFIFHWVKKSKI